MVARCHDVAENFFKTQIEGVCITQKRLLGKYGFNLYISHIKLYI